MNSQRKKCHLLEPDGTRLASASCRLSRTEDGWTALLTGFDAPGRIVQRCLLDRLHDVWLCVDGGVACPGRIEHVYFDPSLGRTCRLSLEPGAALLLAAALNDGVAAILAQPHLQPAGQSLQPVTAA